MIPIWVDSAVSAFGKRMGFADFRLNESGVAAATFENGVNLALEYAAESLCISVRLPVSPNEPFVRKLLVAAHPENHFPFHLRTAYLARRSMALFMVRLGERQVTPAAIDMVFSGLWDLAMKMGANR